MAKQTFTTGQVLTAAQMTSLQQTAMGGGSTTAKTASYVLVAADAGTVVQMDSASATTITINTALFAAGDSVQIQNIGAGVCTVTAGTATVTTAGSLALSQWEGGQLYFTSTSASIFFDVVQASGSSPNYSLLNAGGTALTAASTITVSGISGMNSLMVLVDNVKCTGASEVINFNLNADSTSNYTCLGGVINFPTTYAAGNLARIGAFNGAAYYVMQTSTNTNSSGDAALTITGANSSGIKIIQGLGAAEAATGNSAKTYLSQGYYKGTSTISSVSIKASTNFTAGTIYVYGSA
jgi:hypothetical protein